MRRFVLLALLVVPFSASSAQDVRPVILQSLCIPVAKTEQQDQFGLELINGPGGTWTANLYPVGESKFPKSRVEYPKPTVNFISGPKAGSKVLWLIASAQTPAGVTSVYGEAEFVNGEINPFSVSLLEGPVSDGVDKRHPIEAICKFVNKATPHERVPL
jgi:hypothetical protein